MNDPAATRMFAEAGEAGPVVAEQLAANRGLVAGVVEHLRRTPPRVVMTLARGSSDHAATYAKYLIETRLGLPTLSAAPSITSLYGTPARVEAMLCLAISQSGRSPDLLAGVDGARQGGASTIALVNDPASPLAARADFVLPLHAGTETSVAATKSFIASLAALADLVSSWAGDAALAEAVAGVPELLEQAWQADWSALATGLVEARSLYVVGRGLGLGIAQEAALKLKETCGLHAEAISAAELRHGPMALVEPGFALLVFRQSDETEADVDALARELVSLGARVFVAGAAPEGAVALPAIAADPAIEPLLQIQSFYRAAVALALARGRDPDRPPHLRKVTATL